MPDLIIKPTNTSGNKVIIQDQAGVAVLTTADSGATLSNVTVTSGNLSNSALVYPVGHTVQTSTLNKASTNTNLGTNNGTGTVTWTSTVVTHAITPIYSNSAIVVHANFMGAINDASSDSGYNFRWLRTATGISDSYPAGMYIGTGQSGGDAHCIYSSLVLNTFTRQHQLTLMDENVTVATTPVTYTLQASTYNIDGYAKFGSNTWGNYQWSIFFQEIKR
jgi:hypothetical protein